MRYCATTRVRRNVKHELPDDPLHVTHRYCTWLGCLESAAPRCSAIQLANSVGNRGVRVMNSLRPLCKVLILGAGPLTKLAIIFGGPKLKIQQVQSAANLEDSNIFNALEKQAMLC